MINEFCPAWYSHGGTSLTHEELHLFQMIDRICHFVAVIDGQIFNVIKQVVDLWPVFRRQVCLIFVKMPEMVLLLSESR